MSHQQQHPSQRGQNNNQNHSSGPDKPNPPKSTSNSTRTPHQHGAERRQTPGHASTSIFKNSTNNMGHPVNSNGSSITQGTPWQAAHPNQNPPNTPTPARGSSHSLSSSGGSLNSNGQTMGHYQPSQDYAERMYGNVARHSYGQQSYRDQEQDRNDSWNSHQPVGYPSNGQAIMPFDPEYATPGPYSRPSSPVANLEQMIARGDNGSSDENTAVVPNQVCDFNYSILDFF